MSGKLYEVEEIKDRKFRHGHKYYHVKWKGYSNKWNTWEPEENFAQSQDLIQDYERRMSLKKHASSGENHENVKKNTTLTVSKPIKKMIIRPKNSNVIRITRMNTDKECEKIIFTTKKLNFKKTRNRVKISDSTTEKKNPKGQNEANLKTEKPKSQDEITKGNFEIATPKKIINHIMLDGKRNTKEEILKKMSFEIEWEEKITKDSKKIVPSYQSIEKVKENCPSLLLQYYENFMEFE